MSNQAQVWRKFCFAFLWLPPTALAQEHQEIPLWPNGAPGFENRRTEAEQAKDYWVKNIHNPSITVFLPPKEKATGAGVVICPGGGHRLLVFDGEGVVRVVKEILDFPAFCVAHLCQ